MTDTESKPKTDVEICAGLPVYESAAGHLVIAVQIREDQKDGTVRYRNRPHIEFQKPGLRGHGIFRITPLVVRQLDLPGKTFADKAAAVVAYLEGHQSDPECRFIDPKKEADKPEAQRSRPGQRGTYWRQNDRGVDETHEGLESLRQSLKLWSVAQLRDQLRKFNQAIPTKGEKDTDDAYKTALEDALFAVYKGKPSEEEAATGGVRQGPQTR